MFTAQCKMALDPIAFPLYDNSIISLIVSLVLMFHIMSGIVVCAGFQIVGQSKQKKKSSQLNPRPTFLPIFRLAGIWQANQRQGNYCGQCHKDHTHVSWIVCSFKVTLKSTLR